MPIADDRQWHLLGPSDALRELDSDPERGLSDVEAQRRLVEHGPNEIQRSAGVSPWSIFLAQFKNVLILILLAAVALSALLGQPIEAIAIAVIVMFAAFLGFVQEFRAERALEALEEMASPSATVLRDGQERSVGSRQLVPGDVVYLGTGDKVPADARLIEVANLKLDEAALTGESVPVEKHARPLTGDDLPIADRGNMVFAGTVATYGRGKALVVATGMNTEFGRIAGFLQTVERSRTPLQSDMDRVGRVLARTALVIVAVIAGLGVARGLPPLEMLLFAVALAVAVVPEALPAVVTISLAIGVQRMANRNSLIRRLPAVETLGSVSVICSDKTGTLTRDEMTVRKLLVSGRTVTVSGAGYEPTGEFAADGVTEEPQEALRTLLIAGVLASDASLVHREAGWDIQGDPTEGALVVAAAKAGLHKNELESRSVRIHEIPFTSEDKRMTTVHDGAAGSVAYAKGAPEVILESCSHVLGDEGAVALDPNSRAVILDCADGMAGEALRVLGVSYKPGANLGNAESEMVFLGLVGMIDPPRPEAAAAIRTCLVAGVRPVMITGDHPTTAVAVARELGLLDDERVVTGPELDGMDDAELDDQVSNVAVFARVSPGHKLRVVAALQKQGQFVAMTGDGINDAPALKKANIGIAMGVTGTDVTKEAADMTLTDDNFASIVAAVEEGRGVFENIKKYLMFLLSSNLGEILLLATASILGWPLPLSAVQILYVNLATDGLPALALAVDPHETDLMNRPPRNPKAGFFTRSVVRLMLAGGLWSGAVNLTMFSLIVASGRGLGEAMTMVLVSLVLIQFFKAYNYRSDWRSVFVRPFANKWLNLAVIWELGLLIAVVYLPLFQRALGTYPLPLVDWVIALGVALTIFPVLEVGKWMGRRKGTGPEGHESSMATGVNP